MGQLFSTFGINPSLLLVQAVNFGLALLVLWYFLYTPLMKIIKERREKVAKGVADAEAAAAVREKVESERSGIIASAEKEAESIVDRAVSEGKGERSEIVKSAQERSDSIVEEARAQAEELKRSALAQSEKEIARLAVLSAEKILKES